jgi:fructose-specific phosphotransferase system IIA component
MKISEKLSKDKVVPELKGSSKEEVINELIDLFKGDENVQDIEKIRNAVLEREKIMSTGVGKGFAIPHAKTDAVNDIVAGFGKTSKELDFQSLDGQPVNLVFILIGKENNVGPHIKLLSRISRMMNNDEFRESLANAESADEILNLFENEEKKYFDTN